MGLDERIFQSMGARANSRTVYGVPHGVNRDTRVGTCTKRWVHCTDDGAVLRKYNDLSLT